MFVFVIVLLFSNASLVLRLWICITRIEVK